VIEAPVPDDQRGARLDRFVAGLEGVGSRTTAERLLGAGRVLVDGEVRHKSFRVLPGMTVSVDADIVVGPAELVHDEDVPFRIAYEDEALLVVDKPAGVVVHPAPGRTDGTLVHGLLAEGIAGGDDVDRPGIVHRLDRDTSGLLVVAKSEEVHAALGRAMRERAITRAYAALVHGRPASRAGRIEAAIGRDRGKGRMAVDGSAPRQAVTHFQIAELLPTTTLLDVTLGTGRTHQIRVHLEAIGHPVVGDPSYCPASMDRHGLQRQFLHACRLKLPHPVTGEELEVESGLPDDLVAALAHARRA
jgi:23S rRNA pseudouridine1911/1915/1917 synthase